MTKRSKAPDQAPPRPPRTIPSLFATFRDIPAGCRCDYDILRGAPVRDTGEPPRNNYWALTARHAHCEFIHAPGY